MLFRSKLFARHVAWISVVGHEFRFYPGVAHLFDGIYEFDIACPGVRRGRRFRIHENPGSAGLKDGLPRGRQQRQEVAGEQPRIAMGAAPDLARPGVQSDTAHGRIKGPKPLRH